MSDLKLNPAVVHDDNPGLFQTYPREIALVKKLDRWIMPMLWSTYWLSYFDRNAIALARINHIEKSLDLDSVQYSTGVSILFVGCLLGGVPANMIFIRTKPSSFLSVVMMAWAVRAPQ
ncbi:putative Major facilitator superfamily domain-containing protein [Seiridium cardinale]|uniref:Major facilitator superfamily domain-containing protein n=1 Tax=Seiridium cardinale TaxID=138064 RepID=A0ABR2XAW7_9PEZI